MIVKTEEEIDLIRESSLLVGKTLAEVARLIKPGIQTLELDRVAETFIRDHGAKPGFKGYNGFPFTLCISVNEQVVHGFASKRELKDGDIVSVDCGTYKNGFYGDSAYTFAIGEVKQETLDLLERTKKSLYLGIEKAIVGNRIGDIGFAIQQYVEGFGYSVVRDLVGHGLGAKLHEKPEVPNFGRQGTGPKMMERLVLAIEPMINLGGKKVVVEKDGWTYRTSDRSPSAHFEHDIVVRKGKAEVLSTFEYIEEVLNKKNS